MPLRVFFDTVTLRHFGAVGQLDVVKYVYSSTAQPRWTLEAREEVLRHRGEVGCNEVLREAEGWLGDPVKPGLSDFVSINRILLGLASGHDNPKDAGEAEAHGILPAGLLRAYIFVMGANDDSTRPVGVGNVVGNPDPIFDGASYLDRMAIMCERMRDAGLYNLVWAVGVVEEPFSWCEPRPSVGWDVFTRELESRLHPSDAHSK